MKKTIGLIIIFALILGLAVTGCQPKSEDKPPNILIAYFSWANNTVVDTPDPGDQEAIDALASASVLPPGNTGLLAQWIQEKTGGSLFTIKTADPYPSDFEQCAAQVAEELDASARPALAESVAKIADYDVVFIGFSVWADTPPMAVFSFIEQHDLAGKTIVFFSAFGGGCMDASVKALTAALPDSTIVESTFGASREAFPNAQSDIAVWLDSLEILK